VFPKVVCVVWYCGDGSRYVVPSGGEGESGGVVSELGEHVIGEP
jgi:hypothetical protein